MDRVSLAGWTVLVLALVGYAVGTVVPYPGRSATLPGMMVGIALAVIGTESDVDADSDAGTGTGTDTGTDPGSVGGNGP